MSLGVRIINYMKTIFAFIFATVIAAVTYWAFSIYEFKGRVGVMVSDPFGLLLLIGLFAFAGTVLLAVPTYFVLKKNKIDKTWLLLLSGTVIGGLIIGLSNSGKLWLHPEGFAIGLIAAIVFCFLREKNNLTSNQDFNEK